MNRIQTKKSPRGSRIHRIASLLCLALLALPAYTASLPVKDVLVLFPYAPDYPAWDLYLEGLKQGFAYEKDYTLRFSYEFLNEDRAGGDPAFLPKTAEYYRYKYGLRKPDVVVASTMLESFIDTYGDYAFHGIPIVVASTEATPREQASTNLTYALSSPFDFAKTIDLALTFSPATKRVYIVLGVSAQEEAAAAKLKSLASAFSPEVEFVFLDDLTREDILARIGAAESDSVVLFCWLFRDVTGRDFKSTDVAREIAQISPVPVYGIERQYLGTGIVGGYLWSMVTYGKNVAINAMGLLEDPGYGIPRFRHIEAGAYGLDWNAITRWNLNPGFIPDDALTINHSHGFLEVYGVYVLIFALLLVSNVAFAVALLMYRFAKVRMERELDVMGLRLSLALKEGAELNRRLDSRALRDPLTGLFIRKHVDERISDEYRRFEKTGAEFSLIQVDVDSFSTVNERFGRETGNILLSRIAGELIKLVRLYDVLARWSGEEFMILLPDTDEDTAAAFAERIRKAVSGAVYFEHEHRLVVTISCGIAASGDAGSEADLIRNVGAALEGAQRNGRNRVVRYSSIAGA